MRPQDVIAHRRLLHVWAKDRHRRWGDPFVDGLSENAMYFNHVLEAIVEGAAGESYLVTADMSAVAVAAGKSMPSQTLRLDDLPATAGFLLYDRPIADTPTERKEPDDEHGHEVVGFCWWLQEASEMYRSRNSAGGLWDRVEFMPGPGTARDDEIYDPEDWEWLGLKQYVAIVALTWSNDDRPRSAPTLCPVVASEMSQQMEWEIDGEPVCDHWGLGPTLLATWTIMQQTMATSRVVHPENRAERRRLQRLGMPPEPLVVVTLRRRDVVGEDDQSEPGSVAWTHRWLVGGHWRNQWLPSRATHRLQWISPYVKGPEGKPLVVKEKVHHWMR